MTDLEIGDQVRVTTLITHDEDDPRDAYYNGEIVWFSGTEWVGVRCTNLSHTIHVVDRDRIRNMEPSPKG